MTWRRTLRRFLGPLVQGESGHASLLPRELRGGGWDKWLVGATLGLTAVGLLMVYSTTAVTSERSTAYLESQGLKVLLGFAAFAAGLRIDYHRYGRWAPVLFLLGLVLLVLVLVPGVGYEVKGARRWIRIAGQSLQPVDFARVGFIAYLAFLLSKPRAKLERFTSGLLPGMVALALVLVPVLAQPNLSSSLALTMIAALMMIAGRIPWRHLGLVVSPMVVIAPWVALTHPYQVERLRSWLEFLLGGGRAQAANYQLEQSLLAIGSGGLLGLGLGESRQKWLFLPDAHTDFIFSILGEEFGFLGAVVVIALLLILMWRAHEAARRAPDVFGSLLATGIGVSIAVYAGVNLAVVTGLFPTTGLPLPLVSYGGSAVLATLFSLGVLGNIASQGDDVPREEHGDAS